MDMNFGKAGGSPSDLEPSTISRMRQRTGIALFGRGYSALTPKQRDGVDAALGVFFGELVTLPTEVIEAGASAIENAIAIRGSISHQDALRFAWDATIAALVYDIPVKVRKPGVVIGADPAARQSFRFAGETVERWRDGDVWRARITSFEEPEAFEAPTLGALTDALQARLGVNVG